MLDKIILCCSILLLSSSAIADKACEEETQNGKVGMRLAIDATNVLDWNKVYGYMDRSFYYLLRAQSYCTGKEEKAVAKELFDEYSRLSDQLDCAFHTQQTHAHVAAARKSESLEDAVFHAGWAEYHVDEALARCTNDLDKMETLTPVKEGLASFNKRHEND